jgi:hypothetical protein
MKLHILNEFRNSRNPSISPIVPIQQNNQLTEFPTKGIPQFYEKTALQMPFTVSLPQHQQQTAFPPKQMMSDRENAPSFQQLPLSFLLLQQQQQQYSKGERN